MPESPRWLLCKGRTQELKEILQSAARMNNLELPANLDKILKPQSSGDKKNKGFLDLFRSKYLRLVSICFLCIWFTMNLVYYGLILNMNALGGNIYVNSVSELDYARCPLGVCLLSMVTMTSLFAGLSHLPCAAHNIVLFCFATVFATTTVGY